MKKHEIVCHLPGIFYRRPAPDAEPFAKEGDRVTADTVLGLVEVMKQFSEINSDVEGKVISFTIEDAEEVEIGQVIAIIETD